MGYGIVSLSSDAVKHSTISLVDKLRYQELRLYFLRSIAVRLEPASPADRAGMLYVITCVRRCWFDCRLVLKVDRNKTLL